MNLMTFVSDLSFALIVAGTAIAIGGIMMWYLAPILDPPPPSRKCKCKGHTP